MNYYFKQVISHYIMSRRFNVCKNGILYRTAIYVNFVKNHTYPTNISLYKSIIKGENKYQKDMFNMDHLRFVMMPLFLYPNSYYKYGKIRNWFNEQEFWEKIIVCDPLYDGDHIEDIDKFYKLEKSFIKKIQNTHIDVLDLDINKYEKFLDYEIDGIGCEPTFQSKLLYYAHMLDSNDFVNKYFYL